MGGDRDRDPAAAGRSGLPARRRRRTAGPCHLLRRPGPDPGSDRRRRAGDGTGRDLAGHAGRRPRWTSCRPDRPLQLGAGGPAGRPPPRASRPAGPGRCPLVPQCLGGNRLPDDRRRCRDPPRRPAPGRSRRRRRVGDPDRAAAAGRSSSEVARSVAGRPGGRARPARRLRRSWRAWSTPTPASSGRACSSPATRSTPEARRAGWPSTRTRPLDNAGHVLRPGSDRRPVGPGRGDELRRARPSTGSSGSLEGRRRHAPASCCGRGRPRSRPARPGSIFLPYLAGERSPIWDPLARGAFVGLTLGHTPRAPGPGRRRGRGLRPAPRDRPDRRPPGPRCASCGSAADRPRARPGTSSRPTSPA